MVLHLVKRIKFIFKVQIMVSSDDGFFPLFVNFLTPFLMVSIKNLCFKKVVKKRRNIEKV